MDIFEILESNILAQNALASAILVVAVITLRFALVRSIRRNDSHSTDARRRWLVHIRNGCMALLLFGLVMIWGQELQTMALSLAAFIVAIILATKELILCITGGWLRISSSAFMLGDRIEVSDTRGDVINHTMLTTTIMEIGPGDLTHQYTGRAVVLPNSLFLTSPIINESFTDDYVLHVFTIPLKDTDDWQAAEKYVRDAAAIVCEPYIESAGQYLKQLGQREGLDVPSTEPRVTIQLTEPGRIDLIVRIPTPAREKGRIEQQLLREYLSRCEAGNEDKSKVD